MATIHQTLNLLKDWHFKSLNKTEKDFVLSMLSGLDGLGNVNDWDVADYLTDNQVAFVRNIGRRFLITEKTKI